jgi:hypothetical protein
MVNSEPRVKLEGTSTLILGNSLPSFTVPEVAETYCCCGQSFGWTWQHLELFCPSVHPAPLPRLRYTGM